MKDQYELGLDLFNFWRNRLGLSLRETWHSRPKNERRPKNANDLAREKNRVFMRIQNLEYIMGFEETLSNKLSKESTFSLLAIGADQKYAPLVSLALDYVLCSGNDIRLRSALAEKMPQEIVEQCASSALTQSELKVYYSIFKDPQVSIGSMVFHDVEHEGIRINAPMIAVPYGKKGGLSENLFEYPRRVLLAPINAVLRADLK